jgi:hypothetical protein
VLLLVPDDSSVDLGERSGCMRQGNISNAAAAAAVTQKQQHGGSVAWNESSSTGICWSLLLHCQARAYLQQDVRCATGAAAPATALLRLLLLLRFEAAVVASRGRWVQVLWTGWPASAVLCCLAVLCSHTVLCSHAVLSIGMAIAMWWRGKNPTPPTSTGRPEQQQPELQQQQDSGSI